MNDYTRRCLEMAQRVRQWIIDFASLITVGSIFETKCAEFTAKTNQMEDVAAELIAATAGAKAATDVKGFGRDDVIAPMERARSAALAAEIDFPGTQAKYPYPRNMNNEDLLAAARAYVQNGATDEALLKDHGAPDTWIADIQTAADAWEADMAAQDSVGGTEVAKRALLTSLRGDVMQLKRTINHMVPNYAADDVGAKAAWATASHVEQAPLTPPPPPPGP